MRTNHLPSLDPAVSSALDAAASAIRAARSVAIACHVNPDGDALGSIAALGLAVDQLGKPRFIGWGSSKLIVPGSYKFLPGLGGLTLDFPEEIECAVALDCASPDRLGDFEDRFTRSEIFVNVDHHASNPSFGHINAVDPAVSSSSELVLEILSRLEVSITVDMATCLYTGLCTDTGRFSFAITSARTHAVAGLLIEAGARPDVVSQNVYESHPFGYLKILGRVLRRAQLLENPPLTASYLTLEDLREEGLSIEQTENLINILRTSNESDVTVLCKETEDGWQVSLRSKGGIDVSAIAKELDGGGHRLAAGCTSSLDAEKTIARVHELLRS